MKIITQVLDSMSGKSAAGVRAHLAQASSNGWNTVAEADTNSDGFIENWDGWQLQGGLYRIVFDCDRYFAELGAVSAYPEVVVIFRILDESPAFQVQVTLAPYSYCTYFGTLNDRPGESCPNE